MSSPLSPIISYLVLQDLEQLAMTQLPIQFPIYFRYVDNILLVTPTEFFDTILDIFNSFHERLQFTLEISNSDRINFLDVIIIIDGQSFRLLQKPFREDTSISIPNIYCHKKEVLCMVWWIECYFCLILNFTR